MRQRPQIGWLADGRRLHLQDGPIDLIVEAHGAAADVNAAYEAVVQRFSGLLDELCAELPELRQQARSGRCALKGIVARRMYAAVAPFCADIFITPMAAVAGAVAEEILGAMTSAANLTRAYVNNGGDIALHLSPGEHFTVGLVDRPDTPSLIGTTRIVADDSSRGIATSGWRGRSFSRGIADAVTVLASTAAQADAAATVIANVVDLPAHPQIARVPANELQPDSDLGARLVTHDVGALSQSEVMIALESGGRKARALVEAGLIDGTSLHLQGETLAVALKGVASVAAQRRVLPERSHEMMDA
jgi:ApbE superfamily uncharacterized protein (UPF0280 family)